jgi:hypothetical protein
MPSPRCTIDRWGKASCISAPKEKEADTTNKIMEEKLKKIMEERAKQDTMWCDKEGLNK